MSFKTIVAILLTIFITVVLLQNTAEKEFTIFFIPMTVPGAALMASVGLSAFLLGVIISRPRRKVYQNEDDDYDKEDYTNDRDRQKNDTLSDEDREYIS